MSKRDRANMEVPNAIERLDPGLLARLESDPEAHVRLVEWTSALRGAAIDAHGEAVKAARRAGISWDRIGETLGITRQAAQQRFSSTTATSIADVRRLTGLSAFNEMAALAEAGRRGWHSVGFGPLYHEVVRDEQQWEHRRVSAFGSPRWLLLQDGWELVGGWFPWVYLARPTGQAVISDVAGSTNDSEKGTL